MVGGLQVESSASLSYRFDNSPSIASVEASSRPCEHPPRITLSSSDMESHFQSKYLSISALKILLHALFEDDWTANLRDDRWVVIAPRKLTDVSSKS